jgi:thiamine-phosphate pyrophosphorylase
LRKAPDLPPLYPIVDVEVAERAGWRAFDLACAYLTGGARVLQLRAKTLDGAALLDLASRVVREAERAGALVIINDRADIAALSGAHGVHVGQEDLVPADVRRIVGNDVIVGLSTHTADQIANALTSPVSYLAIGPVFSTSTKDTGYESVGLAAVRRTAVHAAAHGLPVVAIGGITLDNAADVLAAGARSVAVITDLVTADPAARIRQFLKTLEPWDFRR